MVAFAVCGQGVLLEKLCVGNGNERLGGEGTEYLEGGRSKNLGPIESSGDIADPGCPPHPAACGLCHHNSTVPPFRLVVSWWCRPSPATTVCTPKR